MTPTMLRMGRKRLPRPDTLSGSLGATVEQIRKARGLTSQQLAKLAGLGLGTVGRVEAGEGSPSLDTVVAIANALGLSASALMTNVREWHRMKPG